MSSFIKPPKIDSTSSPLSLYKQFGFEYLYEDISSNVGQMYARVLDVWSEDGTNINPGSCHLTMFPDGVSGKIVAIRGLLMGPFGTPMGPDPSKYGESEGGHQKAISMHPLFIAKYPDLPVPAIGSIIEVDFLDREFFRCPIYLGPAKQSLASMGVGGAPGSQMIFNSGGPPYKIPKGKGRFTVPEAAQVCKNVNACLAQRGVQPFEEAILLAFMGVESGFKKPYPGLVRFEPHVWKKDRGFGKGLVNVPGGVPYRAGRTYCPEGYWGGPGAPRGVCNKRTAVDYTPANTGRQAFNFAAQIHLQRAVASSSWGSFQVMGFNMKAIIQNAYGGDYKVFLHQYDTNPDEVNYTMVCHFIALRPKLQAALRMGDWVRVAKIYNGNPAYSVKLTKLYTSMKQQGYA